LRKVSLTIRPQGNGGSAASTTTDNSGNFRFNSVAAGTYTLTGERTGYVRATLGADRGQPQQITINSSQTSGGIQLKLMPHSVISGKVYDLDGDPVQGAQVTVMRYSYPRGQRQLTNIAQGTTNDLGEYRVPALPPGRYYLSASDRGILAALEGAIGDLIGNRGGGGFGPAGQAGPGGAGGPGGPGAAKGARGAIVDQLRNSNTNPEAYVTTYYPRTVEATGATPLDLVAGSEMRPYMRYRIAKAMAGHFLEGAGKLEETGEFGSHLLDVRGNLFAAKLLAPAPLIRREMANVNVAKDVVSQLSETFWVSKTFMNRRLKDILQNQAAL
jgi:hypothetical protein